MFISQRGLQYGPVVEIIARKSIAKAQQRFIEHVVGIGPTTCSIQIFPPSHSLIYVCHTKPLHADANIPEKERDRLVGGFGHRFNGLIIMCYIHGINVGGVDHEFTPLHPTDKSK